MTRGSLSFTRKYGAAVLISLNGAVLWTASIVSHCLSVIYTEIQYRAIRIAREEADLVNNSIPGKPGIVDDDVYFATAKLSSLPHQCINITSISYVARHDYSSIGRDVIDALRDGICLGYTPN
jgi:hypothetical protein